MIDLSFLTEEEQEAIMKVLQRDAELKRKEDERVRHLPEKIKNDNQLKNMSGQWFYEAKSKRHRDKIHGADIIRASIRRKPTTTAERSQNKSDKTKNNWVNNVNKEVSVPAELSGIREETEEGEVKSNQRTLGALTKCMLLSLRSVLQYVFTLSLVYMSCLADTLSPSKETQSKRNILNSRSEEHRQASGEQIDESQRIADQPPVPKARKIIYKITDPVLEKDGSVPKPTKRTDWVSGAGTPPRGILKRSSSSSSTDSEVLRVNQVFDHQSKTALPSSTVLERVAETNPPAEDPSQNSLERLKQVRFSSSIGTKQPLQSPQLQHGKDIGEFDLLESDYVKRAENDSNRLDALQNEQTLPVKSPRSQSSALDVNTRDRDVTQEDTSAPYSSDANRSSLPVNETLQLKTSLPMEPVTPRKSSSNISPNVQEPLSAKTKSPQVPNASSADLQQGKPVLVEDQSAKTTSKPDRHAAELMKVADESISKVLDWFKRSSNTGDENTPSVASQRRESKEELYLPPRTRVITTKDSGPSTDENTQLIDLSFGNSGKPSNVLKPAAVDAEDIQIIKVGKKENLSQETQETDYNKGPIVLRKSKNGREKMHLQVTDLPVTKLDETNILKKSAAEGKMLYKPEDESAAYKEPTFFTEGKGKPGSKSFSSPEKLNEGSLLKTNVQIQKEEEKICTIKSLLEEDHVQSQTGFDNKGTERKEPGLLDQGCMQLEPSSPRTKLPVLPQHESKQPSPIQISDEDMELKKSVRDIRAFWESDTTGPRHTNKEGILSTTLSASSTVQYTNKGNSKVKPTDDSAASLSSESKDQNKYSLVNFRKVELSDDEASKDKFLKSSKTGPDIMAKSKADHTVEKSRKILQSDGKVNEFTKLPKANNLQPRIGLTPTSSKKYEDGKEVSSENDRNPSSTKQKPNFKVLSLKDKIDEESKNQISNPLQFQSLRSFWDIGPKSQSRTNMKNETTSPGNISSVTYQKESKECEESRADTSQEEVIVQQQNQLPERDKTINFKVPELPRQEGQPILRSVNLTRTENTESLQIVGENVGKSVISKPKEKVDLPEQEVKEYIEKMSVPPKEQHSTFNNGLQKLLKEMSEAPLPSIQLVSDKSVPRKELGIDEHPIVSVKTKQSKTAPTDSKEKAVSPKEEVVETVDKTVAPSKAQLDAFNAGLEKLLKETSKISSSSSQNVMERSHNTYPTFQREEMLPQEVKETIERTTVEKTTVPPKAEFHDLDAGLKKLLKEASAISFSSYNVDNSKKAVSENVPEDDQRRYYKRMTETDQATSPKPELREFNASLQKLLKEASEMPPSEQKSFDNEMHVRIQPNRSVNSSYLVDVDHPQEVKETVEKAVAPSKSELSEFNSGLEKLLKEVSEMPPSKLKRLDREMYSMGNVKIQPNQSVNSTYQQEINHPQEVNETVKKAVAPSKAELSEFNSGLKKLLKEVSEMQTPQLKNMDNVMQKSMGMQPNQSVDLTYQQDIDHPQEVNETIAKAVVPSKSELGDFTASLQKLLKEASETPPLKLKTVDSVIQGRTQPNQSAYSPYQQEMDHPQEIEETVEKTVAPTKAECSELNICLEKLLKEASDVSSQLPMKMGKQERPSDSVSQAEKGSLPIKMPLAGPSASSGYCTEFKIPIKRETLKQNDKALKEDHVVNEVRASTLPMHKMEIKNENEREEAAGKEVDKSASLADASEATSEVNAPFRFRRLSTPLKDDDRSSKISKVELLLASPYDDEDDTISFGSDLSGSEELDPILKALKRSADRQRPSKSLEDIPSATSSEHKAFSTVPSDLDHQFSNPEKLKRLSQSVPAFLQEESDRDTDTTSESSYPHGRIKKSPSSLTNLSGSSGMASLSSVSGSVMSIYSGDFGNVDVKGHIQFAIDYVEQLKELHIFVSQCKDLAIADVKKQHSDPYVKTYLLPEKYKLGKRKTSVKKKTLNPVYNEILRYKIDKALVKTQRLNLSVWHNDTFGRNSFLGEVELDLGTWDWNDKLNKQMNWFPLKPRVTAALELENRGEIKLALQYVPEPVGGNKTPSTGEVHIWVKECNDLPLLRGNKINSFVKCTILPDTSRKSRQKTRAVAKTTNPVFNHTMVYDGFRADDLKEACVELTVWDHNKLANHFLGGLRIGMGTGKSYGIAVDWMDSTLEETTLWERMMSSPNTWVEDTLPLRMLMVAKLAK
uniref:Synaptotagmin-like protein 2 n=1 Tax=Chelonoidis abingdonii TaxID=106734 RepID=A0A8C0HKB3_CHEAB